MYCSRLEANLRQLIHALAPMVRRFTIGFDVDLQYEGHQVLQVFISFPYACHNFIRKLPRLFLSQAPSFPPIFNIQS